MSATQEPPPSVSARLFVGNLVPSISDIALLRLFSRFGDTSDLQRNIDEGYAHLSIKLNGHNASNDTERVVTSLNRTTWCGTTLRVERAQEHFLHRLRREWEEERNNCADQDVEKQQPSADHFTNYKKGKHTKFSFPDVEIEEPALGNEIYNESDATGEENSSEEGSAPSEPEPNAGAANAPRGPIPVKSARLDSTLALFGLSSTAVERSQRTTQGTIDSKRDRPTREQSPPKRPRISKKSNDERTDEANDDPSVVDIDAEKDKQRMILQKLFPESQATLNVASCRRLGLYRNLVPSSDDGPIRDKRSGTQGDLSMLDTEPSWRERPGRGGADAGADMFRRAGLYKKLLIPTPSELK